MKSIIFGLALARVAAAQVVNGMSYVSAPTTTAGSSDNSYGGYGGSGSGSAPPSAYTQPPSSTSDFYQVMPYSSMTSGGYMSLSCGYGYSKGSDGYCYAESWVSASFFLDGEHLILNIVI